MKKLGTVLAALSVAAAGCQGTSDNSLVNGPTVSTGTRSFESQDTVCLKSSLSLVALAGDIQVGGADTIGGDVLLLNNSSLQLGGNVNVGGTIYLDTDASFREGGACSYGDVNQQDRSSDYAYLTNFIDKLDSLTPTQEIESITSSTTINRTATLNVIHVAKDLVLGGQQFLTLNGQKHDVFVINVDGDVKMGGADGIVLSGDLQATNVIINAVGTGNDIQVGGNCQVNGTLVASNRGIHIGGDDTINGALVSGMGIHIGGANCVWNPQPFCITSAPSPTPSPSPSVSPTPDPSASPTASASPTPDPSASPTASASPTPVPSTSPTASPSPSPSPSCTSLVCPGTPFGNLGN